jgi:hypothetical protein
MQYNYIEETNDLTPATWYRLRKALRSVEYHTLYCALENGTSAFLNFACACEEEDISPELGGKSHITGREPGLGGDRRQK